ncbi:hypothetical protein [Priestia megaterium]|uniref:hypothetical protein n=1 Tax=Priestia megaterium TaxID=1404 RepID=UPI00207AB8B3|nr:hypothetical protein [Priestia megaterium]USL39616.1 hypothetical protein LIT34_30250 [Priestia megaterium]
MNNIINFYEFRRHRKIKKFLRFGVVIGIITIFCVFAYLLIITGMHHPTEFPSYIEPKP